MESPGTLPTPANLQMEEGVSTINESPSPIRDRGTVAVDHSLIDSPSAADKDATITGHPRQEDDVALLARLVAGALKESVAELRKDDETRMSQLTTTFQRELSAFREYEENKLAQLKKAAKVDPTTNFWTAYKKFADEYDTNLVSRCAGDLDTTLVFAGLFSAITSAFIVQIISELQPDPADLTNALLLRILQQNTSFGGSDPLTPASNIPTSAATVQSILFTSLSITLFVAFIAVFGRQWVYNYTRSTPRGNIVDRGKERQAKLMGLQKWGLYLILESLPVMLQFSLLLFGAALVVYLWGLDVSVAEVVLVVSSLSVIFYACIAMVAAICYGYPFQTPLSVRLSKFPQWAKISTTLARVWWRRRTTSLLLRIKRVTDHRSGAFSRHYPMTLSNPASWRQDPLFTSSSPMDIAASAGFWLLENSTDSSAASAVAAAFPEIQWPAHYHSTTALIRLRDTYIECFRAPEFNKPTRLKALQSAAAYYVLYHTQLIWSTLQSFEVEVEKLPSDLPPDLLHLPSDEWGGDDVFEYLLRIEDRSEPITSARFLSYIAPYWFCGDSDAAIRFRPSRLQALSELIEVLEKFRALDRATVTDCVLCMGAVMDFPLHPEDLIRVDKSDYFVSTFQAVVEHIHGIVLAAGRRRRHAQKALEILLTLVKKTPLPLIDAAWINGLLKRAAGGGIGDENFTLFMRLSARRKEEDAVADVKTPSSQQYTHTKGGVTDPLSHRGTVSSQTPVPEYILFSEITRNIQTRIQEEGGWRDEAVYGGLIAIKDIPGLGICLPEVEFLQTLSKAMEKGENKPFRVRKAAYDIILAARDGWLKSPVLRPTLEDLDIPRQLHSVVIETGRSDHQRSFLEIIEILSQDRYWHPYLRGAMNIWVPLRHEGLDCVLRILATVGELLLPERDGYNVDKPLEKVVEDEWAGVPGRLVQDITADRLKPLAEVTKQFKKLLFTESDRRAVLAMVEQTIPSLERRRDDGYDGPGDDIRSVVSDLLEELREPTQSSSR